MERRGYNLFNAIALVWKFWQGKLSGTELEEYRRMKQATGLGKYAGEFEDREKVLAALRQPSRFDADGAYRTFLSRTRQERLHNVRLRWLRMSAAVLLPLLIGGGLWLMYSRTGETRNPGKESESFGGVAMVTLADGTRRELNGRMQEISEKDGTLIRQQEGQLIYDSKQRAGQGEVMYNELYVPRGAEYMLTLADGTKVWLNADSRLRYPVKFNGATREVFLSGEAYFAVQHDSLRSFIVSASTGNVNVMGTEFNVRDYPDESQVVTTLVKGVVSYADRAGAYEHIILKPGEQVQAGRNGMKPEVAEVEPYEFTSWKDGIYVFNKATLEDMMRIIERNYDITIFFNGENLKNLRFSGKLKKYGRIEEFLNVIETGGDVTFTVKGRTITVNPK